MSETELQGPIDPVRGWVTVMSDGRIAPMYGLPCIWIARKQAEIACVEGRRVAEVEIREVNPAGKGTRMAEIKVFAMNDCDWMAGESLESVKEEYSKNYSGDYDSLDEPHELTDEELDELRFARTDDDDKPCGTCTFRERLNELMAEGQEFPCFFASTEY